MYICYLLGNLYGFIKTFIGNVSNNAHNEEKQSERKLIFYLHNSHYMSCLMNSTFL